jgi:hypothetical protein
MAFTLFWVGHGTVDMIEVFEIPMDTNITLAMILRGARTRSSYDSALRDKEHDCRATS